MTPKSEDFPEKCSLQAICWIWAALPGAQHLERCFASNFEVTRRALAVRVIRVQGQISCNWPPANRWPGPIVFQDFSFSTSSFATGPRYPFRALKMLQNDLCIVSWLLFLAKIILPNQNVTPVKITKNLASPKSSKSSKNALCELPADFCRPCRGLSTWKGASPRIRK